MPREEIRDKEYTIGKILSEGNKAAILAKPGGGKSALIRGLRLRMHIRREKRKWTTVCRMKAGSLFIFAVVILGKFCRAAGKLLPTVYDC